MSGLAVRRELRNEEILHERGDPARAMGWVVRGAILFGRYLKHDGFSSLVRLGPGHHFGEFSALDLQPGVYLPRRLAAIADEPSIINEISAEKLAPLLRQDPEYLRAFHIANSSRLSTLLELYDDARRLPAGPRIINFLAMIERRQSDGPVPCTQADMSRLLGLSKVTVNQTLRKLIDQGVLTASYGSIRFKDRQRLQDMTDKA